MIGDLTICSLRYIGASLRDLIGLSIGSNLKLPQIGTRVVLD
jgi:hypothetical protein